MFRLKFCTILGVVLAVIDSTSQAVRYFQSLSRLAITDGFRLRQLAPGNHWFLCRRRVCWKLFGGPLRGREQIQRPPGPLPSLKADFSMREWGHLVETLRLTREHPLSLRFDGINLSFLPSCTPFDKDRHQERLHLL